MKIVRLEGEDLAFLLNQLVLPGDGIKVLRVAIDDNQLMAVKINEGMWTPSFGTPQQFRALQQTVITPGVGPGWALKEIGDVIEIAKGWPTRRVYLDLSQRVITATEMQQITQAPPTVISHTYGAWVHVSPREPDDWDELTLAADEDWADFPNLLVVLQASRDYGASWVSLDPDGKDVFPDLPVFDW